MKVMGEEKDSRAFHTHTHKGDHRVAAILMI